MCQFDSVSQAQPYTDGALLGIRKVSTFTGLSRGLDMVLEL
jgi:4-hydroxy-tetrahydrodipicolinate reductase